MMKRFLIPIIFVFGIILSGTSWAQSWDFNLYAGSESASGGLHYRQFVETGYVKFGGSALYCDDGDNSIRVGSVDFFAGSDTLSPGLTVEVGLRGIFGSAEEDGNKGDLGGFAFSGGVEYFFSPRAFPLPIEFLGALTYGPNALSFEDAESYWEFTLGAGVRIGRNASIRLIHTTYNVEMETGSNDWSVTTNRLGLGLVLRF